MVWTAWARYNLIIFLIAINSPSEDITVEFVQMAAFGFNDEALGRLIHNTRAVVARHDSAIHTRQRGVNSITLFKTLHHSITAHGKAVLRAVITGHGNDCDDNVTVCQSRLARMAGDGGV